MKAILSAIVIPLLITHSVLAQQATPPALPPGASVSTEMGEAEVLKVYAMEDQGAKFRAYAIKYKGNEVIVDDDLAKTNMKVGDNLKFIAILVEVPSGSEKIRAIKFKPFYSPMPMPPVPSPVPMSLVPRAK